MAIFLFEAAAILLFAKLAELRLLKRLVPLLLLAIFIRFFEHFLLVDWFHLWKIHGPKWMEIWLPITADLTIWPITCYLFIQFLPEKGRLWYCGLWAGIMLVYLWTLKWSGVFSMQYGWAMGISSVVVFLYFVLLLVTWRWLRNTA
ncbi:hypothetical protein [Effusibacillus lacus]|uniref:Uncharacterized protein n=1 Tax=Effusibacillus lacus TaxID=1348429 RepID=A0A292YCB2_9BACL|nr:hypothetical protein [Effusibacillus lacus]TCS75466.1 hypothetical protein EDD64_10721 [Effusibacillus lacus]GAX88932.1 hypothetical protein EFBL_0546 [Effusibacillus lacus]